MKEAGDFVTLWLDHGPSPRSAHFAYAVLPGGASSARRTPASRLQSVERKAGRIHKIQRSTDPPKNP